jgi:hypothetical protein
MGLVIGILALLVSVTFNLLQLKWRNEGRAKDRNREAEQRSREQAPPEFYNFGGTPGPILVSGNEHSQGFMDFWGNLTVVNPTQGHMKITPLRLVIAGEERPVQGVSFHPKSFSGGAFDRISLMGNSKEDYELRFRFSEGNPPFGDGELWLSSDNRPGEFSVPIRFPST